MTSVPLARPPRDPNGPLTHALVIGVGKYPYLLDGDRYDDLLAARVTMGLGQLDSPPISAEAFANWLLDEYASPTAELGSLEVLLSPGIFQRPDASGALVQSVERATMQNIKAAFDRWERRCHADSGNVAVFYFCGHGLQCEVLLLLAEDFGANVNRPWENCIDFDTTWYGMGECRAATQCYFLDCCRETPIELLKAFTARTEALKTATGLAVSPRNAPVFKAAAVGQRAHGPVGDVSYFTQGLLRCLREVGAHRFDGNKWIVTTDSLETAMKYALARTRLPDGRRCLCEVDGTTVSLVDFHELPGDATVMTEIGCMPPQATADAEFEVANAAGPVQWRPRDPAPWEVDIAAGTYDLHARFPMGHYNETSASSVLVHPPFYPHRFRIVP